MLSRGAFEASGGCPEYTPWGREDEDFHSRVAEVVETVREPVPGFRHQGHPNPLMWKDRDADPESAQRWELAQASQMIDEMSQHIPAGAKYICVDDAYFRSNPVPGRHGIPFLERDGEYWGSPADGETAVRELVRLRSQGVEYLAFLYPSFWWLQHYAELKSFIGRHYRWVLRNDRVWICDLSRGPATQPHPQSVPEFYSRQTRRVATDSA
jgi:hypothetical protein